MVVLHERCSWQKLWGDVGAAQFSKSSPQPLLQALQEQIVASKKKKTACPVDIKKHIFMIFQNKCKCKGHWLTLLKHTVTNVHLEKSFKPISI